MAKDKVSPVREQYLSIKRKHPNEILFFRLGDFYETFDEDAEITSRELDIVLTSRSVSKGIRVPMAGIPHHAADNYLARLIEKGYHVAICEQIGEQPIKGIFPRQVTRVVTPGTVMEPGLLSGDGNNYLVSIVLSETSQSAKVEIEQALRAGISYVDITTGEFGVTEIDDTSLSNSLQAEIARLNPSEILYPENTSIQKSLNGHITAWPVWRFEHGRCREQLMRHFNVGSLDGFGLRGKTLSVRAAGAILQYLAETQPASLNLLSQLSTYSLSEFMVIDAATRRNLELTETIRDKDVKGSFLGIIDHTVTPMGNRLIYQWVSKPLLEVEEIHKRQEAVEFFHKEGLVRAEVRALLKLLGDLERLTNRVVSGSAQPRDLVSIRTTLTVLPELSQILPENEEALGLVVDNLDNCSDVLTLLTTAIEDDPPATLQNIGVIRPGFSSELDGVQENSRHAREWIANLEAGERKRTGIKTLKVGYNKVFGYYIEVTRASADQVPSEYIRKQTLVNAERFITPEMKEYETLVLNAEDRIREIEARLFRDLCAQISLSAHRLIATAKSLARLDVLVSFAEAAVSGSYVRPQVVFDDVLEIHEGRHPVVEKYLIGERFVPNDVVFAEDERIRIITGPNMSGKSTVIRQVALIILLAQIGSYVPASSAHIGLVDRIFTRIGAQDEIHAGQSTFMVEMVETANILHHATSRSLIILDEVGRGTSTYDGVSIAWSVVEYIHNHPRMRSKTLFATHYHELTQLADLLPGVTNYNVAVSESDGRVVFLHKIVPGGADRSYGIHVGQLAGLPLPVVQRASEILQQLEATSGTTVKINPELPKQLVFFPETNPLIEELDSLDVNTLSPIEALNKLYEWQRRFVKGD